ncbi:MAG: IS6 family transposase [Sphingomonas sp.]
MVAGDIVAGPHVRNACKRHVADLKRKDGIWFDQTAANLAFAFFEEVLKLSLGQFEGEPFELQPSQAFIVGSLFGWKRKDGRRRFRRNYIERGIDVCHETVRFWWNRFGPIFASEIRRQRVSRMRGFRYWRWHLDEVFVRINGERHYLWRVVDREGEVLESYVTKKRDKVAALAFLKKALKRHGRVANIVTDGLRSYPAAMRALGNLDRREMGRWLNNRAENSHRSFRRRERATQRFRRIKSLQKFASVHASFHNHFDQKRHLVDSQTYKIRRSAALAEWQSLAA